MDEREIRNETVCRGCGSPKRPGMAVCWQCFKGHTPGKPALKTCGLEVEEWIALYGIDTSPGKETDR